MFRSLEPICTCAMSSDFSAVKASRAPGSLGAGSLAEMDSFHWIGSRQTIYRRPRFWPFHLGVSGRFSRKPLPCWKSQSWVRWLGNQDFHMWRWKQWSLVKPTKTQSRHGNANKNIDISRCISIHVYICTYTSISTYIYIYIKLYI